MPEDTVLSTIRQFPSQLKESFGALIDSDIKFSPDHILNVVLCGMGGSALGARVVHSLFSESLKVPFEIVNGYHVPFYTGEKTLLILSSYSGSTEETIACFHEGREKKAQIFTISSGGALDGLGKDLGYSGYTIDPKFNPSNQPRLALGYSVGSILALFSRLQFINLTKELYLESVEKLDSYLREFDPESPDNLNEAKKISNELEGKIPVLIASEHLVGAAHAFKNQINETAKMFSSLFDLPELNHHLLEGMKFPEDLGGHVRFVFFESNLYSERVIKRIAVTKEVLDKQRIEYVSYKLHSGDKLTQALEFLTFGSYVQYYLALKHKVNMTEIPWVDYFKEKMGK